MDKEKDEVKDLEVEEELDEEELDDEELEDDLEEDYEKGSKYCEKVEKKEESE